MSHLYRDLLLDHAKRPRHTGVLHDANRTRHEANPSCGDVIDVYLRIVDDASIAQATFMGRGCVISQASASLVLEHVQGKSTAAVLAMTAEDVVGLLGVQPGPMRMNCALLSLKALQKALC